jgi:phosphatidylserine/phosphatidylglycerophosphate/cardiolipin synthase-like enzyme
LELIIQPDDGLAPILKAIDRAKSNIEVAIFRCDRTEVEKALANAVARGVLVRALIAHTSRNGEKNLRELERRLLAAGVNVARTADNLARYHDKLMILDRRKLYVLSFNFVYLDTKHSRSFGIATSNRPLVQEAAALFEADAKRQPYSAGLDTFIVSPENARKQLTSFIKKAKRELLIYDPTVSDPSMVRLLEERVSAGVEVRIIGSLARKNSKLAVRRMPHLRLHTRTIVRDGRHAFVGSQSLRAQELDARREVGIVVRDAKVVARLLKTFYSDWAQAVDSKRREAHSEDVLPPSKVAKKVAKAVADELPPVAPVIDGVVREIGRSEGVGLKIGDIAETVNEAVKDAVKDVVRDIVEEAVDETAKQ